MLGYTPIVKTFKAGCAFFFPALCALILIASPSHGYVGKWRNFTSVSSINALLPYHGFLFAATTGGIRKINPANFEEKVFTNADGVVDLNVVGLVIDGEDVLWAASRSGRLFRFEGDHWTTWGNGYMAEGWKINKRAILSAGNYLILGTEKGLTFFDRKKGVAQTNLSKFGKSILNQITGLVRSGDTLFIANGTEVMQAPVDFNNILSSKFGTIYDPQIWVATKNITEPKDYGFPIKDSVAAPIDSLDSLATDTLPADVTQGRPIHLNLFDGHLIAHDTGEVIVSPYKVRALFGRTLIVDGKAFPEFKSMEAIAVMGEKIFLGSQYYLTCYSVPTKQISMVYQKRNYPWEVAVNIAASTNGVYVQSSSALFKVDGENINPIFTFGVMPELLGNELRLLSVTKEGRVIMGNWGKGVFDISGGDRKNYLAGSETCLIPTVGDSYTAVQNLSDPQGDDIWFTQLRLPQTNPTSVWLGHLNLKTGKVSCPELAGDGYHTFAMRILSDTLIGVAGDRGIFLYRWQKNGNPASLTYVGRLGADRGTDIGRDLAPDRFGRLWAITNDQLGFVDSLNYKLAKSMPLTMAFPDNMEGKACRVMETDALQNLWIGCDNGLFHLQPTAQGESPIVERFTSQDGLASDRVFDISVVKETGVVWVATEGGISVYESDGAPLPAGIEEVKAYPNPFLKKHRLMILEGIPAGGTAAIYTQSGNVVRQFDSKDRKGNQFQWDGNNASGSTVKPGVYFYSVSLNGKSSRGKIIVAR